MHCDIYPLLNNPETILYTMASVTLSPYNYISSIEIVSIASEDMHMLRFICG